MKDLVVCVSGNMVGEFQKQWLLNMINEEIDDETGTIENIKLWTKGAKDEVEAAMFKRNLADHVIYKYILRTMKKRIENFERYDRTDKQEALVKLTALRSQLNPYDIVDEEYRQALAVAIKELGGDIRE